ncbi:MAG: hypothetical protein NTY67_03365 [Cyanobacteria bacterium]|nr:hypothetical protein [Cyanobacteriota bacterium]
MVVTASEVGGNVVFSGGGTLNLADLSPTLSSCFVNGYVEPNTGIYQGGGVGKCSYSNIYGPISGPTTLGTGRDYVLADSISGDFSGINNLYNGLVIPDTYTSGGSIFGTSTFLNKTFASLGLTPGIYDWVWGSSNPDSYRLCIGSGPCAPASSSVPGPLPLFGAGVAFSWSRRLRKRIATPLITTPQA